MSAIRPRTGYGDQSAAYVRFRINDAGNLICVSQRDPPAFLPLTREAANALKATGNFPSRLSKYGYNSRAAPAQIEALHVRVGGC